MYGVRRAVDQLAPHRREELCNRIVSENKKRTGSRETADRQAQDKARKWPPLLPLIRLQDPTVSSCSSRNFPFRLLPSAQLGDATKIETKKKKCSVWVRLSITNLNGARLKKGRTKKKKGKNVKKKRTSTPRTVNVKSN